LGLVSISSLLEETQQQQQQQQQHYPTATTLDFTGGTCIAYFAAAATNGTSTGTPTSAEVEMLVMMAFSDENDLVPALQQSFPYITKATLLWKNDGKTPTQQQQQEPFVATTQPPLSQPQNAMQQQPSQRPQTAGFPNSSLLIGMVCAVTGAVAISTLLMVRHRQHQQHQGHPTKKKKTSELVTAATLDSPNNNINNNNDISDNNISVDTGSELEYNCNDDEDSILAQT
jgi:hypothetical protein